LRVSSLSPFSTAVRTTRGSFTSPSLDLSSSSAFFRAFFRALNFI